MRRLVATLAVLAAIGGCGGDGGGDDDPAERPTATPTATPRAAPTAPAGLDGEAINAARDEFVEVCKQRESEPDEDSMSRLRAAARVLTEAFEAEPDTPFSRSPGTPAVSMRQRLQSLALLARTQCGGADARRLGDRLARAAAPDDR